MERMYNAFLVRHWSLDGERGQRIEVVHVLVASMSQATTWMRTRTNSDDHSDPPRANCTYVNNLR
jgi:hypothetical protein